MIIEYMIQDKIIEAMNQKQDVKLSQKRIKDQHIVFLCQQDTQQVEKLRLKSNFFTPIGIKHLAEANWSNLRHLGLWGNLVGNKGCKYLSKANMKALEYLGLGKPYGKIGECRIEAAGLLHLSKGRWENVKQISLSLNKLAQNSVKIFNKFNWKNMRVIYLDQNRLGVSELSQLLLSDQSSIKSLQAQANSIEEEEETKLSAFLSQKYNDDIQFNYY